MQWRARWWVASLLLAVSVSGGGGSSSSSSAGADDGAPLREFLQWLGRRSISTAGFEVADFGAQGRGLRATRHFRRGEVLLRVPARAMVTSAVASRDIAAALNGTTAAQLNLTRCEAVTLFLMRQRRRQQQRAAPDDGATMDWAPFVRVLPTRPRIPLFWASSAAGRAALQVLYAAPTHRAPMLAKLRRFRESRAAMARRTWAHPDPAVRAALFPGLRTAQAHGAKSDDDDDDDGGPRPSTLKLMPHTKARPKPGWRTDQHILAMHRLPWPAWQTEHTC